MRLRQQLRQEQAPDPQPQAPSRVLRYEVVNPQSPPSRPPAFLDGAGTKKDYRELPGLKSMLAGDEVCTCGRCFGGPVACGEWRENDKTTLGVTYARGHGVDDEMQDKLEGIVTNAQQIEAQMIRQANLDAFIATQAQATQEVVAAIAQENAQLRSALGDLMYGTPPATDDEGTA